MKVDTSAIIKQAKRGLLAIALLFGGTAGIACVDVGNARDLDWLMVIGFILVIFCFGHFGKKFF